MSCVLSLYTVPVEFIGAPIGAKKKKKKQRPSDFFLSHLCMQTWVVVLLKIHPRNVAMDCVLSIKHSIKHTSIKPVQSTLQDPSPSVDQL